MAEADRLVDSCPRHNYSMQDVPYNEAMRTLYEISLESQCRLVQLQCRGIALQGSMVETALTGGWRLASELSRLLKIDGEMRAMWAAWERFCNRLGLDPRTTLDPGKEMPISFRLGSAAILLDGELPEDEYPEVDEAMVTVYEEYYRGRWARVDKHEPWNRVRAA